MDRSTLYQVGVAAFGILAIVCSFLASWEKGKEEKAKAEKGAALEASRDQDLKRLGAQVGHLDMTQEYIATLQKATQRYIGEAATRDVDDFVRSKEERKKLRGGVETATQTALALARVRIQPICDVFVGTVDAWVKELEARGTKVTYTRDEKDCVVTTARRNEIVRTITFASGAKIVVYLLPATVEDGRFHHAFMIALQYEPKDGHDGYQCSVSVSDSSYELANYKSARYTFQPYESKGATNPIDDESFLKQVRKAMAQVLGHLFDLNE